MSPSLISSPFGSIDRQKLRAGSDPSMHNNVHISSTLADASLLSAYPPYHTYSNSASPSVFSTPAELTSENSAFSDYDYHGDDEFFGVDFDAAEQAIDASQLITEDIPIPTTELPAVEAYLPAAPGHTNQSSETATNSTYPMSSNQSTPPSRHSPKSELHGSKAGLTVSHYDLAGDVPAPGMTTTADTPITREASQRGLEAGGLMGGDNTTFLSHSPMVTITPSWGMEEREIAPDEDLQDMQYVEQEFPWFDGIQDQSFSSRQFAGVQTLQASAVSTPHLGVAEEVTEAEDSYAPSGRMGVEPGRRRSLSDALVPNFKDQEEQARLELKKLEVEEWRSQAGDSNSAEEVGPYQSQSSLSASEATSRRRARSTGEFPGHLPNAEFPVPQTSADTVEGKDIDSVSDTASVRENQLKGGQIYYNPTATAIDDRDRKLFMHPRHWSDAPVYPYMTDSRYQPSTSNEASKRFMELADNFSVLSRSATWGTRRRSEPSIADIESIKNGGLLKRLSINNRKDKRPGPGGLFKDSLNQLTSIVRRKSDSKLKRGRSDREGGRGGRSDVSPTIKKEGQATLGLYPGSLGHKRGASTSRLNTNVGGSSFAGSMQSGSGGAGTMATSPKSSLGFVNSVIRRARSRSELPQESPGLAKLWRESGGPPLPSFASPAGGEPVNPPEVTKPAEQIKPLEYGKPEEYSDAEGEDDDDEDVADDGEMEDFDQSTPIAPNFAGFREHVLKLHPAMGQNYLVERIAHQQVVRYKTLLGWRVKHSAAIAKNNCAAGPHCISLGGSATLFESKSQPRDHDPNNGLQIMTDPSDGDSNPEGALGPESFPQGVPTPPAQSLPAEFECQLCFKVKKFQKPSDWTKHVHEDVQPFTCTYSSCKEPKSFKRKADWVRHENERHRRLGWWTCQYDECTHKCYRKDNFLQHLVREHKIQEPQQKQKTKAAAKKARNSDEPIWVMIRNCHHETTAKPQDEPCKFCGKVMNSWKKLTVHLAKHMEVISLSVLRLVEQQQVDGNTIISPVEPLPVRHSPLTPIDPGRRISNSSAAQFSNMSASISPHVPQIGNFSSPAYQHQTSPNMAVLPQYSSGLYGQGFSFNATTSNQEIPFNLQPSLPQQQQRYMFDNNGMPYTPIGQMPSHLNNTQSRGFTAMDHSPHLDQTGFTTVNATNFPTSIPQQGFHSHSYPSSIQTLSPDPAASGFVPGPQQMSSFQAHTLPSTNPARYSSSRGHGNGPPFPAQHGQAQGLQQDDTFKFQVLSGTDTGSVIGFEQHQHQVPMMRGQGGMGGGGGGGGNGGGVYPPTTNGGYGYQG